MKKKQKTELKKAKDKAWELLSKVTRKEKPTCELCNQPSAHAHHIIPRARGNSVYFNERNIMALCAGCHLGWHNRWSPKEKEEATFKAKGDFDDVESIKWDIVKYKVDDYKQMIEEYKARLT